MRDFAYAEDEFEQEDRSIAAHIVCGVAVLGQLTGYSAHGEPHRISIVEPQDPSPWAAAVVKQLTQLLRLQDGWDGAGASAISPSAVILALYQLQRLLPDDAPAPAMVPTIEGGLQAEWHER